jgi:hypothetical protein
LGCASIGFRPWLSILRPLFSIARPLVSDPGLLFCPGLDIVMVDLLICLPHITIATEATWGRSCILWKRRRYFMHSVFRLSARILIRPLVSECSMFMMSSTALSLSAK